MVMIDKITKEMMEILSQWFKPINTGIRMGEYLEEKDVKLCIKKKNRYNSTIEAIDKQNFEVMP
jgi:hypothetical protein